MRRLHFLVGDWTATGRTFPEKYGDRAGPASGRASYRRVNQGVWLLSEVTLQSTFAYGVIVMIASDAAAGGYRAYAMTSFAPRAIVYEGRWVDDATLVFEGSVDAAGTVRQRVTYAKTDDGSLQFRAEESLDGGRTYVPDSELILRRSGN